MCFQINGNIVYHGKTIGKEELEREKQKLKNLLCRWRLEREEVVALSMRRTPSLLAAIFALLEEGIPFLPLDVQMPQERLSYMMDTAEVTDIITDIIEDVEFLGRRVRRTTDCIDESLYEIERKNIENEELAYLLFTSGTTGLPKAIEVCRRGLRNFIEAIPEVVDFPEESRIGCLTSQTFDIFFLESVMALNEGMTVVLADEEERSNPKKIQKLIQIQKINVLQMTPSALMMLRMVDEGFACLKGIETILVGGEVFPEELLKQLQKSTNGKIYNMYGPTETTIWSMVADLTESKQVHIGRPIRETEICIVNDQLEELPAGEEGEIVVLGSGVAKGYRNNKEKTKESFIQMEHCGVSQMAYRTGDYGFLNSSGQYVFCGRRDNQIKIMGHRIELDDIEGNIVRIPSIQNAMVAVYGDDVKRLVCFYLSKGVISEEELRRKAREYLPDYMVPGKWVFVEEFIFTNSNKADRNAMVSKYVDPSVTVSLLKEGTEENDEIFQQLMACLECKDKDICLEDSIEGYAVDSLKYIHMVVAIEDSFGIEFDDEMLSIHYFKNFQQLFDYIISSL